MFAYNYLGSGGVRNVGVWGGGVDLGVERFLLFKVEN